jgi:hypothetical protein
MSTKLNELKKTLGLGARGNKYQLLGEIPTGGTSSVDIDTLAKATSMPGKEIGVIEVFNQGRKINVVGDTTFDGTWTITILLTQDHKLRNDFIKWQNYCDNFDEHHRGESSDIGHNDYMTESFKVKQLNTSTNEVMNTINLHNVWCSGVGEISYDDSSNDEIVEVEVTLSYSHWTQE